MMKNEEIKTAHDVSLEVKDDDTFKMLLKSTLPVVVDYWAPWCGPCQEMKPIFHKLTTKHSKIAKFATVDIDKHPTLSKSIEVIPTFVVYSNGKMMGRVVGGSSYEKLESKLLSFIRKGNMARHKISLADRRRMLDEIRSHDRY